MTTLGYGDIFPISPLARAVVTGEALVGQLFPAIFIAAMVSLAMRQQTRLTAPPPAGAPPAQPPADAPARPPTAS
jgi:voltage-gated potassium channel Kch